MAKRVTSILKTSSEEETFRVGAELAKTLKPGSTICLTGDLGTGKTALTKGIAFGMGIKDTITSPTFTLVNSYESDINLHHFDIYRIDDPEELLEIGWDEYFGQDAICVVEWGDKAPHILPADTIRVNIARDGQNPEDRQITIEREA